MALAQFKMIQGGIVMNKNETNGGKMESMTTDELTAMLNEQMSDGGNVMLNEIAMPGVVAKVAIPEVNN